MQRWENAVSKLPNAIGYAILLTNRGLYSRSFPKEAISDSLRLSEGRKTTGTLSRSAASGKGTTNGRQSPITLKGNHDCEWRDHSEFAPIDYVLVDRRFSVRGSELRYLLFTVRHDL